MGERQKLSVVQHGLAFAADDEAGIAQEQPFQLLVFRELQNIISDGTLPVQRAIKGRVGTQLEQDFLFIIILHAVADLKGVSAQNVGENQIEPVRIARQCLFIVRKLEDSLRICSFNKGEFAASGKTVIANAVGVAACPDFSAAGCPDNREQYRRTACPEFCIAAPDIFIAGSQQFEAAQLSS
ncbi:hypothetical protein D3C76_1257800 [compost metagenome]